MLSNYSIIKKPFVLEFIQSYIRTKKLREFKEKRFIMRSKPQLNT